MRRVGVVRRPLRDNPVYQAYWILHVALAAVPILGGFDKLFHVVSAWEPYFGSRIARLFGVEPRALGMVVGATEIVVGFVVAVRPTAGAYLLAIWLFAFVVDLVFAGAYVLALSEVVLLLAALALARLGERFPEPIRLRVPAQRIAKLRPS
ncbi:MAG: hypothetical protein HOW73_26270 [Polyangiaceae bacterium]|nr:hypothetical protein [Polyangiaceae bacterium]